MTDPEKPPIAETVANLRDPEKLPVAETTATTHSSWPRFILYILSSLALLCLANILLVSECPSAIPSQDTFFLVVSFANQLLMLLSATGSGHGVVADVEWYHAALYMFLMGALFEGTGFLGCQTDSGWRMVGAWVVGSGSFHLAVVSDVEDLKERTGVYGSFVCVVVEIVTGLSEVFIFKCRQRFGLEPIMLGEVLPRYRVNSAAVSPTSKEQSPSAGMVQLTNTDSIISATTSGVPSSEEAK